MGQVIPLHSVCMDQVMVLRGAGTWHLAILVVGLGHGDHMTSGSAHTTDTNKRHHAL